MKKYHCFLLITSILLFSCKEDKKNSNLMEIPVDIEQSLSFPLSEIVEEITAIELELTDESLINPDIMNLKRILICANHVIVAERDKILVFGMDGKFIRSIGSKGQGPGEYTSIKNLAIDENNKRLFVNAISKIICYDLDGNYLNESSNIQQVGSRIDINHINGTLFLIVEQVGKKDSKGLFNHSVLYRLNDDLQIMDSCTIRNSYFERPIMYTHFYEDFLLYCNTMAYLYFSEIYFNMCNPAETVLRDTLYRIEDNKLIPELKMKFKNNGIDMYGNKFIHLFNMYRSSRYVFAIYHNENNKNDYRFCYDTKTGKGYNMQDGFIDDIKKIEKRVDIRPFNTNSDMFYYWHTHIKPDDREEPNPTLYIGKLKK